MAPLGLALTSRTVKADATLHPTQLPSQAANVEFTLGCLAAALRDNVVTPPCALSTDAAIVAAMTTVRDALGVVPWGSPIWQTLRSWEPLNAAGIDPAKPIARKSAAGLGVRQPMG